VQTRGIGYLFDDDGDGVYDRFYSDTTKYITKVQQKDDNYLIDVDGDGKTDYVYNTDHGLTAYQASETPGFEIIILIGAITLVMFWKRKRKNNE
jgi:hypothetical protein